MSRFRKLMLGATGVVALGSATAFPTIAQQAIDRSVLPLPAPKFEGVIGKTYKESNEAGQSCRRRPPVHPTWS